MSLEVDGPMSPRQLPNHSARRDLPRSPYPIGTVPLTIIEPPTGQYRLGLGELWEYRDLLYFLAWRDVKVRYKQTIIGVAWAVLQPFLTMVVFSVVLGRLVNMPASDIPYPLFVYSALVPWSYFTHALTKSVTSMVNDQALVTQIYIPRLILPLAAVLGGLVDFALAFVVLLLLMLYYGMMPTLAILTLPFFTILVVATAFAISVWLAPLNAQYRDVANAIPFLLQLWLFLTPIAYPSSAIPESWQAVYGLNPMVGAIEGFRWALVGSSVPPPWYVMAVSVFAMLGLLFLGLYFFHRKEETLADVV